MSIKSKLNPSPFAKVDLDQRPAHKVCRECREVQPIEAFEGTVDGRCLSCHERGRLARIAERQRERAMEAMEEIAAEMGAGAVALPKIHEMISSIISEFGSMGAMTHHWKECLDATKPSVGKLNHFVAIYKLIFAANQQEHNEAIDRLTVEQAREAQLEMAKAMNLELSLELEARRSTHRLLEVQATYNDPQYEDDADVSIGSDQVGSAGEAYPEAGIGGNDPVPPEQPPAPVPPSEVAGESGSRGEEMLGEGDDRVAPASPHE